MTNAINHGDDMLPGDMPKMRFDALNEGALGNGNVVLKDLSNAPDAKKTADVCGI